MSDDTNEEKKKPFKRIQADLKSALDTWENVSSKTTKTSRKAPDDDQLDEIRKLLGTLQDKMKDFEPEA